MLLMALILERLHFNEQVMGRGRCFYQKEHLLFLWNSFFHGIAFAAAFPEK